MLRLCGILGLDRLESPPFTTHVWQRTRIGREVQQAMSPGTRAVRDQLHDVLVRRTRILQAINRLNSEDLPSQSGNEILKRCGEILLRYSNFCGAWIGRYNPENAGIVPLSFLQPFAGEDHGSREVSRRQILLDKPLITPIEHVLQTHRNCIARDISPPLTIPLLPGEISCRSYGIWPFKHQDSMYGIIALYSSNIDAFPEAEVDFLETAIADLSLTLYSHDVSVQLQFERDFNNEIIDTIQALMVAITPCGKILRFNPEAERVTGYKQKDVLNRYWVDVLLSSDDRLHYQNIISDLLKSDSKHLGFRAPLMTSDGNSHIFDWHGSIKPDIETGTVGMVLFGIDVTDRLNAVHKYDRALAKWENIFATIQDPALIVSRKGIILDANHATFSASRKTRNEVIGESVCKILHGGRKKGSSCPLIDLIHTGKSRILHTELVGLHGDYLLTVSPLKDSPDTEEATLLVARDMTEEERHKAEAIRASQLASIGELAAGVAHEINNPINAILNYAQMLHDLTLDEQGAAIADRITTESKRIAGIVRNLLDFSRHRIEEPEPVDSRQLLEDCLELVHHQLLRDDIILDIDFANALPLIFCNPSQIQQVLLNIINNSRYALNERFPQPHPQKKLVFSGSVVQQGKTPYVRLKITDFGTGIEHHILDRVFDPFFSTKPNGQGTGLGLSISYGLIQENGGNMRIHSRFNNFTAITLDLPTASKENNAND